LASQVASIHQISAIRTIKGIQYHNNRSTLFEKAVKYHQLPADLLSEPVALGLAIGIAG
jgi:hypothetical protein